MLPQNNRDTMQPRSPLCGKGTTASRAALWCCLMLAAMAIQPLAAQKAATNVKGQFIPREMGDIPDNAIQFQQIDKKPLKFTARAHYILIPVIVTDKDGKHVSGSDF